MVINSSDCELIEIDEEQERQFFENNLNDSKISQSIVSYGLFYEDVLVQVMSFGKPRYNKNYQWELFNFYTKKATVVDGELPLAKAQRLLSFIRV